MRFERIVVVKLDGLKTLFSTLALFVSIAFPVFLEFADYLDEDHAYLLRVFVSTGIVLAGIALIFSDKLVMRTQARFVDKVLAKQVANFVGQLRGSIPILNQYPANFSLKPIHEVTAALKEKAGVEDDDSSLQDEYRVLNELNDGLKLLRENTFRLSDLKTFYDIKQVIVFENMPWTSACTRILDEIEDSRSKLIGRIVRENDLGYFQVNGGGNPPHYGLMNILKDFAKVVLTGARHPRAAELDEWMNASLSSTTGVQADPGLVILYRVHCAMIDELYTHGTTLIAKTLQIITAEDACSCFGRNLRAPPREVRLEIVALEPLALAAAPFQTLRQRHQLARRCINLSIKCRSPTASFRDSNSRCVQPVHSARLQICNSVSAQSPHPRR